MTPDDEYYTGSETATPTSTSAMEKRRSNPNHTNDQRQKAWQKNINLLWQEIANHKNGTMFMNPIKKSYAPLYDKVVKQPLYLKTIKNRVRDGVSFKFSLSLFLLIFFSRLLKLRQNLKEM